MDPTLSVLVYSGVAAGAAALGAAPFAGHARLSLRWIGWANAVAAGVMLGAAYLLIMAGLERDAPAGAAGALLGMGFVAAAHALAGTQDLELNRLDAVSPIYGYQVLLVNALHAAPEGIAIGGAMAVGLPFGILMALGIAVHNVPEGAVLSAILTSRGLRAGRAAGLAVAANLNQVLLAVATFALVAAAPALLPWALGFAAGALVYLVMSDLLPECYHQAGRTSIALVTVVAMAILVLLGRGAH